MGQFLNAVQAGSVPGPLRRQFRLAQWDAKFAQLGSDDDDKRLHDLGRLIFGKAEAIRGQLRITLSKELSPTSKVRALVALANQNMILVREKAGQAMAEVVERTDRPLVTDITGVKIELPVGVGYTVDEINQSVVDGLEVPLRVILEGTQDLSGTPKFSKLSWADATLDFNLGNFYAFLEGLWDDCLWNGYTCERFGSVLRFAPTELFWEELKAASEARAGNLAMQFFGIWGAHYEGLMLAGRTPRSNLKHVSEIRRKARRQVVRFAANGEHVAGTQYLDAARAYASEPYYGGLLHEAQDRLDGGSLNSLLNGWAVASSVSRALHRRAANLKRPEALSQVSWLPDCAAVVDRTTLVDAVKSGANLSFKHANAVVEFLTFRGRPEQELWAQPFVPFSQTALGPVFGAAEHANLRRLVDVWMRQLEVDMGRRGPAFERHVRSTIARLVKDSILRESASCLAEAFVFRPTGARSEEMDLVLRVGDAVVVGEAKCSVVPTEAKQYAMHRRMVIDAVAQVKRKAQSVTENSIEFREQLKVRGISLPERFRVIPAVVLNGAVNAGISVGDVAVVDLHVFETFFCGELIDLATITAAEGVQTVSKRVLYGNAEEAAERIERLLSAPIQMEAFLNGVVPRWVPMPAVDEVDWAAEYLCMDCKPKAVMEIPPEVPGAGKSAKKPPGYWTLYQGSSAT